jgi:hypothetical protein
MDEGDDLHQPSPVPDWLARGVRVTCRRCGRVLATLTVEGTHSGSRYRDAWALSPAPGLVDDAPHAGKAVTLVCPRDGHRATVKASTLGRQIEHDTTVTVLRV